MKLLHTPSTQKGRTSLPPPHFCHASQFIAHLLHRYPHLVPDGSGDEHTNSRGDPQEHLSLLPPLLTAAQKPRAALTGCLRPLFRPHVSTGCCWHPSCERHIRRVEQIYTPVLAWGPHQLWTQLRNRCRGDTGTEIHHATREGATQRESENQNPLLSMFSAFPTPFLHVQPPLQTHSAALDLQGAPLPHGQFHP